MQSEILEQHAEAELRVYAVWFNMYPGDARSKWPATLLTDPRVTHWWDEPKAVGEWYGRHKDAMRDRLTTDSNGAGGDVLWDSYLLYDSTARWNESPTGLIHWGRTIVAARETLRADIERLFALSRGRTEIDGRWVIANILWERRTKGRPWHARFG